MRNDGDLRKRVHARNAGLRRLRVMTGAAAVGTAALAGVFAGFAAEKSAAGKVIRVRQRPTAAQRIAAAAERRPGRIPAPPKLPPIGSAAAPPAAPAPGTPPPPVQPPVPASAPPVVVSGGS